MFKGVDHVVVAVKDLEAAIGRYETLYDAKVSDRSESAAAGMKMAFFRFAENYVELVTADQGPIAKRLAETGDGVHLVAMRVENLEKTVTALRDKGVRLIGDPGAGNPIKGQVFVHPSVTGVLTQLVQR
jgi:methylmalonyl-CoA/ethylmalonyl-CoA epimerase